MGNPKQLLTFCFECPTPNGMPEILLIGNSRFHLRIQESVDEIVGDNRHPDGQVQSGRYRNDPERLHNRQQMGMVGS